MEEDPGILPERVLNLSIEIIALLSGETFPTATSGDLLKIMVPPLHSVISDETKKRIVDVANKIIELLTGQDVAVYLSMDERDYLEGHMEFYKEVITDNLQKKTMMQDLQKKTMMDGLQKETIMEDIQEKTMMEDIQMKTTIKGSQMKTLMKDHQEKTIMGDLQMKMENSQMEDCELKTLMEDLQKRTMMEDLQNKTIMEDVQKKTLMVEPCLEEDKETMMEDHKMDGSYPQDLEAHGTSLHVKNEGLMSEITLVKDEEVEIPVTVKEEERTLEVATDGFCSQDVKDHGRSHHVKEEGLEVEMAVVKDEEMDFPKTVKEEEIVLEVGKDGFCSQDVKDHGRSHHVKDEGLEVEMAVVKDEVMDLPKTVKKEEIVLEVGKDGICSQDVKDHGRSHHVKEEGLEVEMAVVKDEEMDFPKTVKEEEIVLEVGKGEPDAQVGQIYNIQEVLENSVILNIQPALPLANRAVEIPNTEESPACFEEPSSTKESGLGDSTILHLVIGSEGGWAEDIKDSQRSHIEISCSDSEAVKPMEDDVGDTLPSKVSRSNVQDSGSSEEAVSVEVEVEVTPTEGCSKQKTPSGSMVQITPKCEECGKTFSNKNSLVAHQKRHLIPPLTCSMCDKTFTHKNSLKAHERRHSGKLTYSCSECGKVFLKQGAWNNHQQRHSGEKPYVCVDCGYRFAVKGDLISHRRVHTQERPYSCLVCSKSFRNTSNLRRHQSVHTGEKSYVCPTCGKRYAQKKNLYSHQKVHAGDAQAIALEAPAKRSLLPQNKQNSKQRIRPKKTYTCHLCHKSFGHNSNLTRHHRVHTGEKLFPCLTCGKRYSLKQHLLSHQKVHTGETKEMKTLAPEMVIQRFLLSTMTIITDPNFTEGQTFSL